RGLVSDALSIALGNGLLLLGFAEMARAVRGFQGLPERRLAYWTLVSLVVVALMVFAEGWPHYSARVLVNSTCAAILPGAIALALTRAYPRQGFTAARLTGAFAGLGMLVALWRFIEHAFYPRAVGSLFDAGASDIAVFTYACVGVTFLSLGFVLMHTERAYD